MSRIRGKRIMITRHASDEMNAEVPHIKFEHLEEVLYNPDMVQADKYLKWIGRRTIIAYVTEHDDYVEVRSVSATRRRIIR
jgi:hypothetical protein